MCASSLWEFFKSANLAASASAESPSSDVADGSPLEARPLIFMGSSPPCPVPFAVGHRRYGSTHDLWVSVYDGLAAHCSRRKAESPSG